MPISDNAKKTLQGLHVAASKAGAGYTYANPKAPMVANLISSGHLTADHDFKDPADAAKVAIALTPVGKAELGLAAPAAQPAAPSFAGPGQPTPETQEATQTAQDAALDNAPDKVKRGPRIPPIIATASARLPLPVATRGGPGGKKEPTYPFASLAEPNDEGHDWFHVAATPANPNPAKSLAGTVSSANKRSKGEGKKFSVTSGTHPETGVPGAFVWRIK